MRTVRLLALAFVLLAFSAVPAVAQTIVGPGQPTLLVYNTTATVSASTQVATAQTLISQTIATQLVGTAPLHLHLDGVIASANSTPGTWTVAFTFGSITLTVVNAQTLTDQLENRPWWLDCFVAPTSTTTGKAIYCRTGYNSTGSTDIVFTATTTGTITFGPSQTLSATVTFSNTSVNTGIIVRNSAVTVRSN